MRRHTISALDSSSHSRSSQEDSRSLRTERKDPTNRRSMNPLRNLDQRAEQRPGDNRNNDGGCTYKAKLMWRTLNEPWSGERITPLRSLPASRTDDSTPSKGKIARTDQSLARTAFWPVCEGS